MGTPAWLQAVGLSAVMGATFVLGIWLARRWPRVGGPPESRLNDAILAILGLLLAFTFSMAVEQHNLRRDRLVDDSNAIGDFYTCASLLDEPERGQLQGVVRRYLERRLAIARAHPDNAALTRELKGVSTMHREMEALVHEAVIRRTPVTIPLVNTLNALTSNHAARLAAIRHRLPTSIVALLALASIFSTLLIGMQQGAGGERHLVATVAFIVLVGMVVWVTLDLNQPGRGAITVSQEPLERLLSAMAK